MTLVSIVIPIYNEEENIAELTKRLENSVNSLSANYSFEIIFVDDHSSDKTQEELKKICSGSGIFKSIRMSKNVGSHVAIIAGLSVSKGDCATFMAADLQDPPELINDLLEKRKGGADVVWAVRDMREGVSKRSILLSNTFYGLLNKFTKLSFPPSGADFALLNRKVIDALLKSAGSKPSLGALIAWLGFKQTQILYTKQARKHGKSKWTLTKKLNAFADAFVGFSYLPLRLMSYLGLFVALCGFLYTLVVIALRLIYHTQIEGWASIMVVVLIIGGVQMLMIGVIGEYLWRNLEESRKRPLFFIEESINTGS